MEELLFSLECAESNLQDDIQALSYIQETYNTGNLEEFILTKEEISNQLQTLLKSMLYNRENILKSIEKVYSIKKKKM